jgi:trans-aconitate methyltransferase
MTKLKKTDQMWDASFYNQYATPQFNIATTALSQWKFQGDENILDIGCGNGAITSLLASKFAPKGIVTGIDLSNDMINFAQKTFKSKNLDFKALDACDIAFDKKFDLVFSFYCLHWVKDQQKAFQNIANSLKDSNSKALLYLMTDSVSSEYSITRFIKEVIDSDKWKSYFKNYTLPWYFQTVNSVKEIFGKLGMKIAQLDLVPQQITFPNAESCSLWLKAVPIAAHVPPNRQLELMTDLTKNYFKYVKANDNGTVPFVLPTIKIVAGK